MRQRKMTCGVVLRCIDYHMIQLAVVHFFFVFWLSSKTSTQYQKTHMLLIFSFLSAAVKSDKTLSLRLTTSTTGWHILKLDIFVY